MSGFLALSRDYLHHPVVGIHDPEAFAAWCWMLSEAAWGPRRIQVAGRVITLAAGQLSHSVRFLADKLGWSKSRMDRFLRTLERDGLISRCGTAGEAGPGTSQRLITIRDDTMFPPQDGGNDPANGTPNGTGPGQRRDKEKTINKDSSPPPSDPRATTENSDEMAGHTPQASPPPNATHPQPSFALKPPPGPDPVGRMVERWNAMAREAGLPVARAITAKRRAAAERWLRDCGGSGLWEALLERIRASAVLTGRTGRMRVDLDFALDPHQATRIMEGSYDDVPLPAGPRLVAAEGQPVDTAPDCQQAPGPNGGPGSAVRRPHAPWAGRRAPRAGDDADSYRALLARCLFGDHPAAVDPSGGLACGGARA